MIEQQDRQWLERALADFLREARDAVRDAVREGIENARAEDVERIREDVAALRAWAQSRGLG